MMPGKIELQMDFMKSENIGFVYCGRRIEYNGTAYKDEEINLPNFKEGDLSTEVSVYVIGVTNTLLIRKSILEKVGGSDEYLSACQEYDLCIKILQKTRAALVRKLLVLYRVINIDKNRNANYICNWEKSVRPIEQKYKQLYKNLRYLDETRRKFYKYVDGYNRARIKGIYQLQFKYIILALVHPLVLYVGMVKIMYKNTRL